MILQAGSHQRAAPAQESVRRPDSEIASPHRARLCGEVFTAFWQCCAHVDDCGE
jgi:hypothetical protein